MSVIMSSRLSQALCLAVSLTISASDVCACEWQAELDRLRCHIPNPHHLQAFGAHQASTGASGEAVSPGDEIVAPDGAPDSGVAAIRWRRDRADKHSVMRGRGGAGPDQSCFRDADAGKLRRDPELSAQTQEDLPFSLSLGDR